MPTVSSRPRPKRSPPATPSSGRPLTTSSGTSTPTCRSSPIPWSSSWTGSPKIPALGVAGVPFVEQAGGAYDYRFTNIEHVSGACQLFRRECFEAIGGYKPIEGGGIDWLAVTTARMMGWKTRTFTERTVIHHRKIGTGGQQEARRSCSGRVSRNTIWEATPFGRFSAPSIK